MRVVGISRMQLRTASANDVLQICQLADEIAELHHGQAPDVFLPPDADRDREFWVSAIGQPAATVFVAADGDKVVGFITAKLWSGAAAPFLTQRIMCRIGTIVVSRDARRQGIGVLLIRGAEGWAAAQHAVEVRLEVFAFNEAAVAFYKKLGYDVQSQNMSRTLA